MTDISTGKAFTRRDFGKGLAAILAAGVAPALLGQTARGLMHRNLGGRIATSGGGGGGKYHGYVEDGLVAYWDGIDNTGDGDAAHDSNATVWKDLVGANNLDFTLVSGKYTWSGNSITNTASGVIGTLAVDFTDYNTIEAVYNCKNNYGGDWLFSTSRYEQYKYLLIIFHGGASVNQTSGQTTVKPPCCTVVLNTKCSNSFIIDDDGICTQAYKNSIVSSKYSNDNIGTWAFKGLGGRGTGVREAFAIRLYNRPLTSAEVAANYAVDKVRFGLP